MRNLFTQLLQQSYSNQTNDTLSRDYRMGVMSGLDAGHMLCATSNRGTTRFLRLAAMVTLLLTLACTNVWGQTKVTTSNFYKLYSTSNDTYSTLVTNASFPSYAGNTFNAAMNGKLTSVPSISSPHNFAGLNTDTKYYRIKMASGKTLTLTNVANVKKVTFYGNGSSSTRTISVSVAKVSGSGSTFSVTSLSLANSNATIVAYATEDFTGKSGYDANTYYTYTFTASGDVSLWGVYVECGAPACTPCTFKSGDKVYFKDQSSNFDFNALWKVSSGNVYAYFWNDTENAWSSYGTPVDGDWNAANTIYEITVPGSGKEYQHVIFTRGNNNTCFDCSSTWDKTTNQEPCEGKNLFYVSKDKYADHIYYGSWGNFTPAGKTVYFDNRNVSTWTTAYVRIGHGSNNSAWGAMTKVAGTKYLYSQSTSKYASHTDFAIANNQGWTGGNSIDQPESTYSNGSWSGSEYKMTKQTNFQQYAIENDVYLCPKATSVLEHECQFYQVTNTNSTTSSRIDASTTSMSLPSYTVTSSPTNCTVAMVKYTADDFSASSALASGGTVMPTQYIGVTVTPSTGYEFSSVTLTDSKYEQHTAAAAGVTGKYAILGDCEVSASCTPCTYNITYLDGGASDNITFTGNHMPSAPTTHTYNTATTLQKASKAGYVFGGWYDNYSCTGAAITSVGATAKTADFKLYAKWTAVSLTALANNTLYTATDIAPDGLTVSSTEYYYPGVSANNRFNGLGTGSSDADSGPVGFKTANNTVDGTAFTNYLDFSKSASVSSYIPTNHAIQFVIPAAGKLEIWCTTTIYLSNGSSETSIGSVHTMVDVAAGTYYLYAKNGGKKLYGIKFKPTFAVSTVTSTGDNSKGSVSAGASTLLQGATTTITATPATGYQVTNWAVSGTGASVSPSGSSNSNTTTLTMGTANATVTVTFGLISYNVTYSAPSNGDYTIKVGDGGASSATKTANYGNTITLAATPSEGYAFSAWTITNTSTSADVTSSVSLSDANDKDATFTMPAYGVTVTATFAAECTDPSASLDNGAYTIGGSALDLRTLWSSSNTTDGVTFTVTNANGTGATIAGDGYSFSATTAGTATISASQTSTGDYCDASETATVTVSNPTYTVTYDAQGGSVTPAYEDVTTATLPTPTKSGYTFQGWYTSGGTLISGTYNPTADITLHALWREDECSGGGGGGDETLASVAVKSDYTINNIVGSSSISGFDGSNRTQVGSTSEYANKLGSSGYIRISPKTGSSFAAADKIYIRIYNGKSSEKSINVALLQSDGSTKTQLSPVNIASYEVHEFEHTLVANEISGAGYVQVMRGETNGDGGWFVAARIIRAGGSGTCYYVTYNGNGADGGFTTDEASHPSGSNVAVASNSFTKTGYRFTGWKTEPSGGTSYAAGGTISGISSNMTLYAQWEEDVCSPAELAYATASVAKNDGDAPFTNTLTNPNSLSVSYSSSVTSVATVNATSGMVTIVGAGSTVITATWAGDATYCAGTATYTLTVSSDCTPQSLVKTQLTSTTAGTTTGYNDGQYAGDPVIATFEDTKVDGGYKLKSNSKLFVTLKGGFVEGDKINIVVTQASDLTNVGKLLIFYDASTPKLLTTIDAASAGKYTYTLTAANITTLGSTTTIGVYRPSSGDNVSNPLVKSVEVEGCREWAVCTAPDAVAAGSVTGEGATFTITDAENTNNYEIYYSTSSTAPTAETSATVSGISTKSRAVTGLTAETTYYYWVRSNCGGATKSSWVAGTPTTFTTEAAAATNSVTYNGNGSTGGSVPTDDTAYEEGDVVTVLGNTGSLVKTGETFLGWSTNATPSSGTFYPAGYKFYMPNAAVTLYAVWGSAAEEKYYYGSITITAGALTPGSTGTKGFFTNSGGTIATSSAISLSSTPGETDYYYESSTLTHTALNKSSNWNTSSTSKRTIRAFKFKSGSSYTLALGSKTATSIMFYGRCGSASKTMTVGSVDYESPSTKNQFFSHEYTKAGNFTGNVTITQDGDFYGILVVTVSTGAGSNHTVTFNMNGKGSAIEPITDVPDGSKIGAPVPSPTAVGAEFGGWYEEAGCSNAWDFATGTITDDKTLFAKWTTCAPSISAHPVAATYTQGAAATALSVTASGESLNYQWYTSEDAGADIQGSSAIPGATSASYTPSTSLLGTIYYFCVVSNTCGNAVSNKAAITVNDGRPTPTANWTIEEPEEGGKGFTFSIEVNKGDGTNWDGELIASMLTLSDNAILDGASIEVNNTNKTISGTYGVKAGSSSPVTFYLLLPATTSQSATRLDHDRTFSPCAGGAGDNYIVRVRKDYEKDASNNYRWVTAGAGEITYAVSSSISSAKAASTVASVFDSIMPNDKQYVWVKTYESNTKTIRLYVETSGANVSVNTLYKNTVYATAADKDIVSSDDYSVSYDGSGTAENTGAKGTHYMDITFDSPLAANDIICVKFSSSKVRAYGAILTTVGDGGDQTTGLTWSNSQASGATVEKQEDAADFTITAVRDATALKSLGLISYTSSNTAIATVNASTGLVHIADNIDFGSDEFKTTTITATLAASGCYKKAVITYILKVTKHECEDTPGTITYVDRGCSGMDLTLEGYEEDATIKWYKDGVEIPSATSATYNATVAGEYYAVTHKTCDITSTNSITLEAATATAEKIVDSWYVKNGRRTPDIALVQTTGATNFTVTSGGTITEIGGCTFELKDDGIIYLHGQKEDGSAPSDMTAGDMTITITVSGCTGELSGLDITIHKQAETAKPSVAFVVDGTLRKDGGTATSVSTAKTSDRPLWTYLSSSYALTGCNVYWSVDSKELREYYSQFDAILITDDPNTQTKGTGGVPYVKAFGTMVDVRPILTMEAFVGRYSDGGWHVYNADPTSPNPRQVEMKLECKNHDIFKGLDPNASDNVRTTTDEHGNEYWHVIMVDTTVAPYHNTSKDYKDLPALQGFDPHKFDHMLGVGTIADETLQGGVERQEEPAARMMILGIQNEAMAALTNEGKLIIKNAIEYLLKTNMEDVNDCSNYFTGGPSGTGDNWATSENWSSGKVPDFESRVRILRPVVISGDTKAIVARVDIATSGKSKWVDGECNGKVTVNPRGALIVGGKIRRAEAPHFGIDDLMPTENDDLIVKAATDAPHRQGALIFDNEDGDTHAVVEMWNPSHWEVVDGKKKKYWSYVAVPIQEADIPNFFWYGFTYLYDETSGWIKKSDGTSLYPFQGIGASLQTGNMETFYGPLATTESQDITLTYTGGVGQGMNLIGNSWTAPIQIANFEEDDFGEATATVWVFNTGHENGGSPGSGTTTTAGQWNAIPINAPSVPGYEGLKVIPAMQAFEVNTSSETTLHLDYDRLVRAGRTNLNEPMRAPRRSAAKQLEATMRVRVSGELTHTDVYLLKDARFSNTFDNGWDGHYLSGDDRSAQLYAISEEEGALAFLAQPEIEGTQLGFAPSKNDAEYTFSFFYDGDETLYLNDMKLEESTLIDGENTYMFTYEEGDAANRFYISATPFDKPNIATGTETTGHSEKAQKVIYKDHIYIIRGGKVYGIDGVLVVPNMKQK